MKYPGYWGRDTSLYFIFFIFFLFFFGPLKKLFTLASPMNEVNELFGNNFKNIGSCLLFTSFQQPSS